MPRLSEAQRGLNEIARMMADLNKDDYIEEGVPRVHKDMENLPVSEGEVLADAISAMPEDIDIYLGAQTGYMFIGTPSEYHKVMPELNEKLNDKYINKLVDAEQILINSAYKLQKCSEMMGDLLKNASDIEESVKKLIKGFAKKKFIPVEERRVKEKYRRVNGGVSVIIEGDETGAYWDMDEYKKYLAEHEPTRACLWYYTNLLLMRQMVKDGEDPTEIVEKVLKNVGLEVGA